MQQIFKLTADYELYPVQFAQGRGLFVTVNSHGLLMFLNPSDPRGAPSHYLGFNNIEDLRQYARERDLLQKANR
jgi:hypothetical protein